MGKVIGDITMSLDGYVTGRDPGPDQGLGLGGEALHTWATDPGEVDRHILDDTVGRTGVVLMGRHTFDVVDGPHGWSGDMGYGAERDQSAAPPVLVVTRRPPATVRLADRFTFIAEGLHSAVAKGRAIAAERDVVVMGGGALVRGCLDAGLLDELHLHLAPIVLGGGTPLFGPDGPGPRSLEQIHVHPSAQATHLSYRVLR